MADKGCLLAPLDRLSHLMFRRLFSLALTQLGHRVGWRGRAWQSGARGAWATLAFRPDALAETGVRPGSVVFLATRSLPQTAPQAGLNSSAWQLVKAVPDFSESMARTLNVLGFVGLMVVVSGILGSIWEPIGDGLRHVADGGRRTALERPEVWCNVRSGSGSLKWALRVGIANIDGTGTEFCRGGQPRRSTGPARGYEHRQVSHTSAPTNVQGRVRSALLSERAALLTDFAPLLVHHLKTSCGREPVPEAVPQASSALQRCTRAASARTS